MEHKHSVPSLILCNTVQAELISLAEQERDHFKRELERMAEMLVDYRADRDSAVAELVEMSAENRRLVAERDELFDVRAGIKTRRRAAQNRAIRQPGPARLDPAVAGKAY